MPLEEYQRKRDFGQTPEPPPKIEKKSRNRFVVQKHRATRLHYDFRLEMEGVLKSWAVPKGPSLDPADKRLAMQVEDHPVSYFDFEGVIPAGNYGAGSVMVWDVGTWEPLSPQPVNGKFVPGTDAEASAMLKKGDFKIRLHGKKLNGDFALIHMRSRRQGTKGTEWLLIKKQDDAVVKGYDANEDDVSALTGRSMAEIAGDKKSAEWESSRKASRGKVKAPWLAATLEKLDKQERTAEDKDKRAASDEKMKKAPVAKKGGLALSAHPVDGDLEGIVKRPMPTLIKPMLAESTDKPFDSPGWLYEIKWDGYRAVSFIEDGRVRLLSRTQNDLTGRYEELQVLPELVNAKKAVLDGEVAALDEHGRASFSLMQQRTGIRKHGRQVAAQPDIPIVYYVFDLIYVDGYDLRRVPLEQRKQALSQIVTTNDLVRYSDHFDGGTALFEAAKKQGLEGIVAKHRSSLYEEKRSREWLKIKITQTIDCVIGGHTDPEGTRPYFGSLVLGLYNKKGQLVHVGQVGTGFDHSMLKDIMQVLQERATASTPFYGAVDAKNVHWVRPELVAEVKFTEWTHETAEGGVKLRAPVFLGLRDDKRPEQCVLGQV